MNPTATLAFFLIISLGLSGATSLYIYKNSVLDDPMMTGQEAVFLGWDKNAYDDFSGSWNDLVDIPYEDAPAYYNMNWSAIRGMPACFADNIDNVATSIGWSSITGMPGGFSDGIDNDTTDTNWENLTNVPAGFSDGIDNTSSPLTGFTRLDCIWIGAEELCAPGSKPAALVDHGTSAAWEFTDGQEEQVVFSFKVPSAINLTYMHPVIAIGWSSQNTSADCDWELNYTITGLNEDTTIANEYSNQTYAASSSTANGLTMTEVNISDIQAGDICIHFSLMRDGDDTSDTLDADVHLVGLCFKHYTDVALIG